MDKYIVFWKFKDGSGSGNGEPSSYEEVQDWVSEMNRRYPHIEHWLEKEDNKCHELNET